MLRALKITCILLLLTACNDKPPHYLVLCDDQDGNQWKLADVVKQNGYIMACTYQSPDGTHSYTRKCDSNGCDIE